ncbi:MAG: hypothetical protein ACRDFB_00610 [Rhabdochlamydiaceae bacterium]
MKFRKRSNKLYAPYRKWGSHSLISKEGVIVGTDQTQEWILPWWWYHYKKSNHYPVTFIDFGMSDEIKTWCKLRGTLLRLPVADIFVTEKQEIDSSATYLWENTYGKEFWIERNGWFKKPLACLLATYYTTIWIDLDCEVRGSLQKLFTYADHPSGIAMAKDIYDPLGGKKGYNSGVIVFKRGISLIETWADQAFELNHLYAGDQDILTKIIFDEQLTISELPLIYNWSRCSGENAHAVIHHWHGRHGKTVIANQLTGMISLRSTR